MIGGLDVKEPAVRDLTKTPITTEPSAIAVTSQSLKSSVSIFMCNIQVTNFRLSFVPKEPINNANLIRSSIKLVSYLRCRIVSRLWSRGVYRLGRLVGLGRRDVDRIGSGAYGAELRLWFGLVSHRFLGMIQQLYRVPHVMAENLFWHHI